MKRLTGMFVIAVLMFASPLSSDESFESRLNDAIETSSGYFMSISTNGGYVGLYSLDLKERFGEAAYEKASANEIWVQPPGTPTIGQAYLRAWAITGNRAYLSAARDCGRALGVGSAFRRRLGPSGRCFPSDAGCCYTREGKRLMYLR